MDQYLAKKAKSLLENKKTKIINEPKSLKKRFLKRDKKVTVIIAAYNAEDYIQKSINSIINQTLPFEQIELIVVDDKSEDDTPNIILNNAKKYSNITAILLNNNSGTAAMPRNVGIELVSTDKVMFLDADDWLATDGLEILYNTMEQNNDDFVVGKTIKVVDDGESIHAEFVSYKERLHINPFDMPYVFYHMGPTSKLMKTSIIKENNIRFPEMKFGEDKFFLFRVLLNCENISAITAPIGYINRLSSNNASLTRTTDFLEKREADMKVLEYIVNSRLPLELEKTLVKRLIEYDLIRSCDSFVFLRSNKKYKLLEYIREALNSLKNRSYDVIDTFDSPLHQAAARMAETKKDKDYVDLFEWFKKDKNKHIIVKGDVAYYKVAPFNDEHPYKLIMIPLYIRAKDSYVENKEYVQTFEVYGPQKNKLHYVIIRDRKRYENELQIPVTVDGNIGEFRVGYNELDILQNSLFSVFVRYDGHRLTNVKRTLENNVTYENRNFVFYTTKAGNVGFALKNFKK